MVASLQERLAARVQAAADEVEGLRVRLADTTTRLAEAEANLARVRDAAQILAEVMAEDDADPAAAPAGVPAGAVKRDPRRWQTVPHRSDDADLRSLPQPYRDVLEVMEDSGRLLTSKEICRSLGLAVSNGSREAMRGKLRRLTERGWCAQPAPGRFGLAPGVVGRMP